MSSFIEWKQSHRGIRDQKSAYMAGVEWGESERIRWIQALAQAANGNLDPEMVEEAARILAD